MEFCSQIAGRNNIECKKKHHIPAQLSVIAGPSVLHKVHKVFLQGNQRFRKRIDRRMVMAMFIPL